MLVTIPVPASGNDGEAAVVTQWLIEVGQRVQIGTPLVELETSKSVLVVEATTAGVLLRQLAAEGEEVEVHAPLALVGEPGDEPTSATSLNAPAGGRFGRSDKNGIHPAPTGGDGTDAHPPVRTLFDQEQERRSSSVPELGAAQYTAGHPEASPKELPPADPNYPASPRARLSAFRRGVPLASLEGSGPGGLITVNDVVAFGRAQDNLARSRRQPQPSQPQPMVRQPLYADLEELKDAVPVSRSEAPEAIRIPVTGARKIVAELMSTSLANSAQLTLHRRADARPMVGLRARLQSSPVVQESRITYNDLLMFVVSRIAGRHPKLNAHFYWDGIAQFSVVHLGMAVDTPRGLMVPSVKMADSLSLTGLVSAIRLETQSAMAGTLVGATAEEATITVSNLGAFGVEYFTPVLNLPQVAILGIGALSSKMEACELPLSLTFDHRAADGVDAARFLAELVQGIEHIDTLLAN